MASEQFSASSEKYGFEKLIVWQKAMEFCEHVYKATESFPKEALLGLTSQLRRAFYSIPLNIAEGSASNFKKEFKYFLTIAPRSQYECVTLLELSLSGSFLNKDAYWELFNRCDEVDRLLNVLIKSQISRQRPVFSGQQGKSRELKTKNGQQITDNGQL